MAKSTLQNWVPCYGMSGHQAGHEGWGVGGAFIMNC